MSTRKKLQNMTKPIVSKITLIIYFYLRIFFLDYSKLKQEYKFGYMNKKKSDLKVK